MKLFKGTFGGLLRSLKAFGKRFVGFTGLEATVPMDAARASTVVSWSAANVSFDLLGWA